MYAGKDTIADGLLADSVKLGFEVRRLPFALALKHDVARRHGITVSELNANKTKYRTELQQIGEGRRQIDEDYWVKRWYAQYRLLEPEIGPSGVVVVTDCRYPNEARFISQLGGMVLRVVTPAAVRIKRGTELDPDFPRKFKKLRKHASERMCRKCAVHATISGTLPCSFLYELQNITCEAADSVPAVVR